MSYPEEAQKAAIEGELLEWLIKFLGETGNRNDDLLEHFMLTPDPLLGPELVNLSSLSRICGPEDGMPYPEERSFFEERVSRMIEKIEAGYQPAPLLVSNHALTLADGNHTYEALLRLGFEQYWILRWFRGETIQSRPHVVA